MASWCRNVFFAVWILIGLNPFLDASEIPKRPEGYVNDNAQMISPPMRIKLETLLHAFEESTSNQIVIATFAKLESGSLEDFSIRLAETWKIGQKEKNNGVILLIIKENRAVRIEVGYGLEGVLPDARCKLIIENEIVPAFKQGDFDRGVYQAVQDIISATKGEYRALPARSHYPLLLVVVICILLLVFIMFIVSLLSGQRKLHSGQTISRRGFFVGPYSIGGFGSGSGGFSGGGGGFGGGGASGSW